MNASIGIVHSTMYYVYKYYVHRTIIWYCQSTRYIVLVHRTSEIGEILCTRTMYIVLCTMYIVPLTLLRTSTSWSSDPSPAAKGTFSIFYPRFTARYDIGTYVRTCTSMMYDGHSRATMYPCTMYIVQGTMYMRCTSYDVRCTMYDVVVA